VDRHSVAPAPLTSGPCGELGVAKSRIPLLRKLTNAAGLQKGALSSVPTQRPMVKTEKRHCSFQANANSYRREARDKVIQSPAPAGGGVSL
jgi:hypothetical protein